MYSPPALKPQPLATHPLLAPLPRLAGFGPASLTALAQSAGPRLIDVLLHLPTALQQRPAPTLLAEASSTGQSTISGKVVDARWQRAYGAGRRRPSQVMLEDANGAPLQLVFFQIKPWQQELFTLGAAVVVSGKITHQTGYAQMVHPEVWPADRSDSATTPQLQYRLSPGCHPAQFKRMLAYALSLLPQLPEWLPAALHPTGTTWPDFRAAIQQLHQPHGGSGALTPTSPARQRLAFDELLAQQVALLLARRQLQTTPAPRLAGTALLKKFLAHLPFTLTADQMTALKTIQADLASTLPMLRLVQGDVGAGKTAVAFGAATASVGSGYQVAILAPTELLAQQHLATAERLLAPLGIRVGGLVGALKPAIKTAMQRAIGAGQLDVVIGTHALLEDKVKFNKLGLAIIDEQHRFGVYQRLRLMGDDAHAPHVLALSATPIPRSLALTQFGELDLSLIRQKPPGRQPIITRVLSAARLDELVSALQKPLAEGQQVYWVCPRVAADDKTAVMDATSRAADLAVYFPGQVGLIHGRLRPAEKAAVMQQFRTGGYKILVATTVIEVGVDVPQAGVMVIEHAERFGLAQLHQLRGRVGRGQQQSYCLLLYHGQPRDAAVQRLQTMRETEDGFALAEADLKLRGPGDFVGKAQAGASPYRWVDLTVHENLVPLARQAAQHLLQQPAATANLRLLLETFNRQDAIKILAAG